MARSRAGAATAETGMTCGCSRRSSSESRVGLVIASRCQVRRHAMRSGTLSCPAWRHASSFGGARSSVAAGCTQSVVTRATAKRLKRRGWIGGTATTRQERSGVQARRCRLQSRSCTGSTRCAPRGHPPPRVPLPANNHLPACADDSSHLRLQLQREEVVRRLAREARTHPRTCAGELRRCPDACAAARPPLTRRASVRQLYRRWRMACAHC